MRTELESKEKMHMGIRIQYPNPFCENYQQTYHGRFLVYATCPSCKRNVRISQNKNESPLRSVELGTRKQIEVANVGGAKAGG
jgi:Zn finger protein HypA/HybF involved in hydrogenase expression